MERKNVGFNWLTLVGLGLAVCGCPIALMAGNDKTLAFVIGFVGIVLLIISLLTNKFRVFG